MWEKNHLDFIEANSKEIYLMDMWLVVDFTVIYTYIGDYGS